jgi:hypothetical protein
MESKKSKELQANILINIALLKCFSESYSTYLIKELTKEKAHWFNTSVNACNNFILEVEKDLSPHNKETLQILTDSITDGLVNLKKEIV